MHLFRVMHFASVGIDRPLIHSFFSCRHPQISGPSNWSRSDGAILTGPLFKMRLHKHFSSEFIFFHFYNDPLALLPSIMRLFVAREACFFLERPRTFTQNNSTEHK